MAVLVRWQVVLVFLSSPVALCCPSWGEEGSFLLSLSVLFFCIRWIQSRAHGLRSVFGAVRRPRPTVLSLSVSAGTDTGSSRDVTRHRTSDPGGRGGAYHRSQFSFIIYETHLPSCQTSRRTGYLFSLVPALWRFLVCLCCSCICEYISYSMITIIKLFTLLCHHKYPNSFTSVQDHWLKTLLISIWEQFWLSVIIG